MSALRDEHGKASSSRWAGLVLVVLLVAVIISNVADIQTGPAMVILLALFFLLGFSLSPRYGLLAAVRTRHVPRKH